jgi:hypothetical protein
MITKKNLTLRHLIICLIVLTTLSFKDEKDALHKRKFTINLTEVKDNIPAKRSIMDEMEFKNGKLFSDYLFDKFQYKWIRYRINKDSVFTDSTDTEVRLLEIESTFTDEQNQTVKLNFNIQEWDIDGTIKIVAKNDKIKKYFDLTGFEKGGKPKKEKKPKVPKPKIPEDPQPY